MPDYQTTPPPGGFTSDSGPATGTMGAAAGSLRCQWCSVPLATGVTICPTCGSPGIPDPRMNVPELIDLEISQPDPLAEAAVEHAIAGGEAGLVEWWHNETAADDGSGERGQVVSYEEIERRRLQSLSFIGGAIVVCAVLGWLIGPALLESPFERLTGTTVEDSSDLRGMGTIGGLIVGMFIGATGGWAIWSGG